MKRLKNVRKTMFALSTALLLAIGLTAYSGWVTTHQAPEYSYQSFRQMEHVPDSIAPCSLPKLMDETMMKQGVIYTVSLVCEESGKQATPDQAVLWQEYLFWRGCLRDHHKNDCKAMQN